MEGKIEKGVFRARDVGSGGTPRSFIPVQDTESASSARAPYHAHLKTAENLRTKGGLRRGRGGKRRTDQEGKVGRDFLRSVAGIWWGAEAI